MEHKYHLYIPYQIAQLSDLSWEKKALCGFIYGLSKQEGYCWAKNKTLGELLMKSSHTVSEYISDLRKRSIISEEYEISDTGRRRILKLNPDYIQTDTLMDGLSLDEIDYALIQLPLNDKTLYTVSQKDIDHYKELYPAVDVEQELRSMLGWLEGNPSKRKTRTGIKSFITRWLINAQNRSSAPTYVSTKYNTGETIL